jgi:hypothetical protein
MLAPFDALRERLLRAGIAPRHVRRYLRELDEHLADLTEAQRIAGYDAADAAARAQARLGTEGELAAAMLEQDRFRSLSARFPWLVFGVLPPLGLILGFAVYSVLVVAIAFGSGIAPVHPASAVPAWFVRTATALMDLSNVTVPPLLVFGLALIAQRQRLGLLWPSLAGAVILICGLHACFSAEGRSISIGVGMVLPITPERAGGKLAITWTAFWIQTLLTLTPLAWLRLRRLAPAL